MTSVRKDLFMWLFVRVHLLKDVPTFHHMTIQGRESDNVIKHILVLSDKTNPDDVSVLVKM